ncbi:MAG TPA: argininosuccinate lyase [Candidatus Kapabacteria bacterium]|nr:argininosuccinate lyase [Candidatus Kapabacteria bacterium]
MSEAIEDTKALWSGRFTETLSELAHNFSSSIALDGQLYREDIAGSIAHARMLGAVGIISQDESELLISGLEQILDDIDRGELVFSASEEDVHMAVEKELTIRLGAIGGKLHTGRSRNDQVALDERLYLKRVIAQLDQSILQLQRRFVVIAREHSNTIMPGYTHMQRAQPVLLAHHMLAYVEMFERDRDRLSQCLTRLDVSPLGSAAFAGSPFALDREMVASELGLSGITRNSIDAVSDRDHLIEFAAVGSIIMMHLSRLAEELILWSTTEFAFVTMSDAVTTGSSIMPQKKNPDMAELVRGKTGKVYGALINLLTIMKGLPLSYNRDMQEDKAPMFDVANTVTSSLRIMELVLERSIFHTDRMLDATRAGFLNATEMADHLVKRGMTFRDAHEATGKAVAYCADRGMRLEELTVGEFQKFAPTIDDSIFEVLSPAASIRNKQSAGGTSASSVLENLNYWTAKLD